MEELPDFEDAFEIELSDTNQRTSGSSTAQNNTDGKRLGTKTNVVAATNPTKDLHASSSTSNDRVSSVSLPPTIFDIVSAEDDEDVLQWAEENVGSGTNRRS